MNVQSRPTEDARRNPHGTTDDGTTDDRATDDGATDGGTDDGVMTPWPADARAYAVAKRFMDIVAALFLLAAAFPLMLAVALLVGLTSPGPVLFRQTRLGRGGVPFPLLKFRTMVADAEQQLEARAELRQMFQESFKIARDPRITPVGAFLRRTSLDELPQLINVLQGSMSLIGPRPIVPKELAKYGERGEKLLTVKPGLGGMWQAGGRSDTTYAERIALDMYYIDHRSLWLDLSLLAKTAFCVLTLRGSC